MDRLSIDEIKEKGLLLFECISGSQAYGTQVEGSDTDYKGVYLAPVDQFFGLAHVDQINEDNNDKSYFELGKFIGLLSKSNPNMLEMLNVPPDCVFFRHPIIDLIQPDLFITKACKDTFAGYAKAQIKKARGLNKRILNPIAPERKDVIDFCFVVMGKKSMGLRDWLRSKGWQQEDCGLVGIAHARDLYALYHHVNSDYQGIIKSDAANEVALSSIPKDQEPCAHLVFNKDGYTAHCKSYKDYWKWVEKRNEERYSNTAAHGKRYDAKNMMHTFRLLHMAEEIGLTGKINVRRPDRAFLLDIRKGAFDYEELLTMADEKLLNIEEAFEKSSLPETVDIEAVNAILVKMRSELYDT